MKIIKRTTIKIRQRELVIGGIVKSPDEETTERCPTCHLPLNGQRTLEIEKPAVRELPAATETENE